MIGHTQQSFKAKKIERGGGQFALFPSPLYMYAF